MYHVVKQLETGEFVNVSSHKDLQEALEIARMFNEHWPGEYSVKDAEGNDVTVDRLKMTVGEDEESLADPTLSF